MPKAIVVVVISKEGNISDGVLQLIEELKKSGCNVVVKTADSLGIADILPKQFSAEELQEAILKEMRPITKIG